MADSQTHHHADKQLHAVGHRHLHTTYSICNKIRIDLGTGKNASTLKNIFYISHISRYIAICEKPFFNTKEKMISCTNIAHMGPPCPPMWDRGSKHDVCNNTVIRRTVH
jgi:hypothetical protein